MTVETIRDEGQRLPAPHGKVLGVVDTQTQFDQVVADLQEAGFEKITAIRGDDGVQLLERIEGFSLGDSEEPILRQHIDELKAGHILIAIHAPAGRADEVARVAARHGARFLVHFGFAIVTWLTK